MKTNNAPSTFSRRLSAIWLPVILLCAGTAAYADETTEKALVFYTELLAGFTGLLAAATIGLVWLAFRQSSDTKRVIESMGTTIQHGQMRERAYVFVESIGNTARKWIAGSQEFVWTIGLVNHGKTPAIIESIKVSATVSDRRPWKDDDDRKLDRGGSPVQPLEPLDFWEEKAKQPMATILASGQTSGPIACISARPWFTHGVPDPVKSAVTAAFQPMFWVSGLIEYKDVFGVLHKTSFCFSLDPRDFDKATAYEEEDKKSALNVRT